MSGNFVSENSRIPNITHMWINNTRSDIACRMAPENVCVKYSYYYNNAGKYENDIQQICQDPEFPLLLIFQWKI